MGIFGCDYLGSIGSSEYRCKYSRQTLSAHIAQYICMSSRYVDCADYKNASRCFITSAVCLTLGKPDDCEELLAMRSFRDEWLRCQPDGAAMIEEYYQIAPEIVSKIDEKPDKKSIYANIYQKYIRPCVEHAGRKQFAESKRIYVGMIEALKAQYCKSF